ncbi:thymidylate synthase [Pseudomonas phage PMBT14]|uniref:Thymidylate synthase n=1 Tax=Pseudomonas phage PMBT14 TaxID=2059855 RepID=A0A2I6PI78_9CAUD|nr:thymidylate synthase [Pseudomonas phage PMBT14]AUM59765.1 thymidylate synthase [Pseudomonas phage PMBT14]
MKMKKAISDVFENFGWGAITFRPTRWQGLDVTTQPAALMKEDLHVTMQADLHQNYSLDYYAEAIEPNLPWADKHFEERVCGYPINPGTEWANWPFGVNAEKALDMHGQFNHNYMERYWPVRAGKAPAHPTRGVKEFFDLARHALLLDDTNRGIRHEYGDLGGLVRDLAAEPDTRQAYLPVWFPEDTGDAHKGRKPCTLGYHFIMRNGKLDVTYYMRSCDLANHFRDDVYLTVRLLLWVLDQCRIQNAPAWRDVVPGKFTMHITSLHMFVNDFRKIYGEDE